MLKEEWGGSFMEELLFIPCITDRQLYDIRAVCVGRPGGIVEGTSPYAVGNRILSGADAFR